LRRELLMPPRRRAASRQTCSREFRAREASRISRAPRTRQSETRRLTISPSRRHPAGNRHVDFLKCAASFETSPSENARPALHRRAKANYARRKVCGVRANIPPSQYLLGLRKLCDERNLLLL